MLSILNPYTQQLKVMAIIVISILAFAFFGAAIWIYKDWQYQKAENSRQTENNDQMRKIDSLKYTAQILSKKEINDYLVYENKSLKSNLDKDKINYNKIQSIVSSTFKYKDTIKQETDISGIIEAINNKVPKSQAWIDSTNCQLSKGVVTYDGKTLKVIVTERGFSNKSDAVGIWENRQWKFLGIKTRLFGKKQLTSVTYDECGETKTLKIEKKKD